MTEKGSVFTWGEGREKEGEITKGHGTSLAVWWLKLLAPNAGSMALILGLGPGTNTLHIPQRSQNNSNKGMRKLLGMMGRFITFIKVMFTCVETQIILYCKLLIEIGAIPWDLVLCSLSVIFMSLQNLNSKT